MKKLLILCLICLMALTVNAQKRCVVLDFQKITNVTEEEIDAISYYFRSNFVPTSYTKVEQVLVTRTIRDFGYSRTDMTQQQIVRIGRELDANIIVVGTMNKFMDEYSVDIRVIDAAKVVTMVNESATFQKVSYRDAMEKVAKRLATKLSRGLAGNSDTNVSSGYIDLGLPSETLWKDKNENGFYDYDAAVRSFGSNLPTREQFKELKDKCQWSWTGSGYKVVGPNGNSIVLPAAGYRLCSGRVSNVGSYGNYWSSTPYDSSYAWGLGFDSGKVYMFVDNRCGGRSVRLVQD